MQAAGPTAVRRACQSSTVLLLVLLQISRTCPAGGAEKGAAERQLLAARGLVLSGNFAVTRQELLLRKRLDSIEGLVKRVAAAHQQVDAMLEKNELIRAQLRQVEAAHPAAASSPKSAAAPDAKVPPAERLQSQLPDVTGLGEQTPLQTALIDWINARGALQVTLLEVQRTTDVLDRDYHELGADRNVQQALKNIGNVRLGPAKDYRRHNRLAAAREVFTAAQPVYRESGHWRIGAVLNERTLATFSYAEQNRPTTIAATLAQAIELVPDPAAPAEVQRFGNRDVTVRRATLPALRLGKFVFRDLSVLLLPPEAEDLGSQFGSGALDGCKVRLDPQRMTLELESLAHSVPRGAGAVAQSLSLEVLQFQRRR